MIYIKVVCFCRVQHFDCTGVNKSFFIVLHILLAVTVVREIRIKGLSHNCCRPFSFQSSIVMDIVCYRDEESVAKVRHGTLGRCVRCAGVAGATVLVVGLLGTVSYLTWRQSVLERDIDSLRAAVAVSSAHRARRDVNTTDQTKTFSAHFEAFIDKDLLARQKANGLETLGEYTNNGFKPNDQIYRIWKPTDWTNEKKFEYNPSSGKVTVQKAGLYLIYGQILFHGPTARKSFGIHVNDDTMPVVESIAYNVMQPAGNVVTTRYNQCNSMVVLRLEAGSQVFLKSLESGRTIIPQRSLTYWGLTKL